MADRPDGVRPPERADPQALSRRVAELEAQQERAFDAAEAAARRSALQYRHLFDNSPVSVWEEDFSDIAPWFQDLRSQGVTDLRAHLEAHPDVLLQAASRVRITRVNKAALRLLRLPPETKLECAFSDIFKEETRASFLEELAALWEGRSSIRLEGSGRNNDGGAYHYVLNMLVPQEQDRPRLESVVVVITDITELVEAREALERSQSALQLALAEKAAVLQAIPDTVLSVDRDLTLLEFNRPPHGLCPGSRNLRIGRPVDVPEAAQCPWLDMLRRAVAAPGPEAEAKITCSHCGPAPRTLELRTAPLTDPAGGFAGAVLVVRDVTRLERLESELTVRRQREGLGRMRGKSPAMRQVYDLVEQLAQVDSLALITGPSGTGKELVAESLHYGSPRSKGPLVKVNCSALSENLLESELFGHVRGAFSGAVRDKQGRFEAAQGGTLFLDEIGDISGLIQLKLLRAIETKEFERVGESRTRRADVRLVAATNADLASLVRAGRFREDLYYRLKVVNIVLPPLCRRTEDIPLLAQLFLDEFAAAMGKDIRSMDPAVMERFLRHSWPGNVRELKHAVEHACILCRGDRLLPEHLPVLNEDLAREPAAPQPTPVLLQPAPSLLTRERLVEALALAGGKRAKAARLLGVSRSTLYRRLDEFGLD